MLDENTKDKIKGLFSELLSIDEESLALTKDIKETLDKDVDFKQLEAEKKNLDKRIDDFKESKLSILMSQNRSLKENKKMIKDDIHRFLQTKKKKIVGDIYRYYKVKYNSGDDDLKVVTDNYVELFDM